MLHHTRGIVLKTTPYSENSCVAQILTEKFGPQAYLINGVKSPKAKIKPALLQPASLLELVVYHKPSGQLQRISEAKNNPPYRSIPFDIVKSSLSLFMTEVTYRAVRQQEADERLFDFLHRSYVDLDEQASGSPFTHILFLLHLSRFLGFYPDLNTENGTYFDLKNGVLSTQPLHNLYANEELTKALLQLANLSPTTAQNLPSRALRKELLRMLVHYFEIQIDSFGTLHSLQVLEDVFE